MICSHGVLLTAVQFPLDKSCTLPLPAALPTVIDAEDKLEITFVRVNIVLSAFTLAVTLKEPPVVLAVKAGAVAIPTAFVKTGIGGLDPNVPLAPEAPGVTVNVTAIPASGMPLLSVTLAWSGVIAV